MCCTCRQQPQLMHWSQIRGALLCEWMMKCSCTLNFYLLVRSSRTINCPCSTNASCRYGVNMHEHTYAKKLHAIVSTIHTTHRRRALQSSETTMQCRLRMQHNSLHEATTTRPSAAVHSGRFHSSITHKKADTPCSPQRRHPGVVQLPAAAPPAAVSPH